MPKDNEVDEKVMPDSAARELIANMKPATFTAYSREGVGMSVTLCVTAEDHEKIADALKATVAELRAEVARLRKSNELYSFAMNTAGIDELKRRADAAERRVGELEKLMAAARRAIGDHHAPNDCYATGPMTGDEYLDLVQCPACAFLDQYAAPTGADPT